jgi:hypothetical protein
MGRAGKPRIRTTIHTTHFEKTACNYRAVVTLAAIVLWFR